MNLTALIDLLSESFLASFLLGTDQAASNSTISFQDPVQTGFNVPPREAIEYFQAKKIVRKRDFQKLTREAKASAFTVAGVYRDDVLRGFKDELQLSLARGRTQQQTVRRFRDILSGTATQKMLGDFHLETVFRTNMQTAYGVGRRQVMEQTKESLPFWQYHAVMDDRTRSRHAALNGLILPADNEFWNEHFPPWDFNCRCAITAASELPLGYDRTNPSGLKDEFGDPLVTLSYDDRGLPSKVEYGTSLYDLQVGNFSGIPRYATLQTAIEAGVERVQAARRIEEIRARSLTFQSEEEVNAWAEDNYRGWLHSITKDEIEALQKYKGSGHYMLNRYLRQAKQSVSEHELGKEMFNRWGRHLDRAIEKSVLPDDVIVYRGLKSKGARRVRVGNTFLDRGYASSSLIKETAESFIADEQSVFVEILLHRGQRAVVRAAFMEFPEIRRGVSDESELLLPRGTKFRVLERRRETQSGTKRKLVVLTVEVIK